MQANIRVLYVSHLLAGLTFWWGIEKLFLRSIDVSPSGMATLSALSVGLVLVLDVPAGMLADRWSRRGTLLISAVCAAVGSVLMGLSHDFTGFLWGTIAYAGYLACSNGTYQAMVYDTLHELGRPQDYARVMGRIYAWFCIGAGIADVLSGYVAGWWGFAATFWLTALMAAANIAVIATLRDPTYHRPEHTERAWRSLGRVLGVLMGSVWLRSLVVLYLAVTVYVSFQQDLSQLLILLYTDSAVVLGLVWAGYAFIAAVGSYVAHHFQTRLNSLVYFATVPVILMAAFNHPLSIGWFLVGVFGIMMMTLHLETRFQHEVPSDVRASVLSALSVMGRLVSVPVILALGALAQHQGAFAMAQVLALVMAGLLAFWLFVMRGRQPLPAAGGPGRTTTD